MLLLGSVLAEENQTSYSICLDDSVRFLQTLSRSFRSFRSVRAAQLMAEEAQAQDGGLACGHTPGSSRVGT